jgi:hypothetical protein
MSLLKRVWEFARRRQEIGGQDNSASPLHPIAIEAAAPPSSNEPVMARWWKQNERWSRPKHADRKAKTPELAVAELTFDKQNPWRQFGKNTRHGMPQGSGATGRRA